MANRIKHWTAHISKRRVHPFWEVANGRGTVAVIYTGEADARLMAAAPRLLGSLKHLDAIVRLHEGELRASAKAKLEAARHLIDELKVSP